MGDVEEGEELDGVGCGLVDVGVAVGGGDAEEVEGGRSGSDEECEGVVVAGVEIEPERDGVAGEGEGEGEEEEGREMSDHVEMSIYGIHCKIEYIWY